jgi:hypothetical protein
MLEQLLARQTVIVDAAAHLAGVEVQDLTTCHYRSINCPFVKGHLKAKRREEASEAAHSRQVVGAGAIRIPTDTSRSIKGV